MKKYGLIGYPLTHTFSPKYFSKKFAAADIAAAYQAYEMEDPKGILELFESGISGLNVTIPHKQTVMPYLDEIEKEANEVGAVNTIKKVDGQLIGYNTDIYGFEQSLLKLDAYKNTVGYRALVLGTGGAAQAVAYVLGKLGYSYEFVSRTKGPLRYVDLTPDHMVEARLIINTTPTGMYPKLDSCPAILYDSLSENHLLYDLIYNPEKTVFLKRGEDRGAAIKNGAEMLVLQAERSWEIWNE